MNILNITAMIGGLALFLYGMHILGEGLSKLSGGRMESILSKMTDTPFKGVLLGALTTAVIQSSSATTVMVVGFVNAGIMPLANAVGVIMGANIGTTITSWILSLSGIQSENMFVMMLKPEAFSPILAILGVSLLMFAKSERKKEIGSILAGFSILMFGMDTMSSAMEPLRDIPAFTKLFVAFSNPLLGMAMGAVLTAIIQSSSASVGILQALCLTGTIPYSAVLPIIMGQNIGTCITAILSSIGANVNAKRASFIHLYFNLIGTVLFMTAFYTLHHFIGFRFFEEYATPSGIAVIHSCFNVCATLFLLPFSDKLVWLANKTIPERKEDSPQPQTKLSALSNMDKRFLDNPSFALTQCSKTTNAMLSLAGETVENAVAQLFDYKKESSEYIQDLENYIDTYEEEIQDYLFKISCNSLSEPDSKQVSQIQHCVGNIRRIAYYAMVISKSVGKMEKKKLHFSKEAKKDLAQYSDIVLSLIKHTQIQLEHPNQETAQDIQLLAAEQHTAEKRILKSHKKRLKKGLCSIDMGFMLSDMISALKKITEHSLHIVDTMSDIVDTVPGV